MTTVSYLETNEIKGPMPAELGKKFTCSMLNRCKKNYFIDHSSYIYHPFIYWISNLLYEPCTVHYELFIPVVVDESWWSILGYLFYVRPIRVSWMIFVIHLITRYTCVNLMIVYSVIIEHITHPLIFVLLWLYLMYVKLQFRKYSQVKS